MYVWIHTCICTCIYVHKDNIHVHVLYACMSTHARYIISMSYTHLSLYICKDSKQYTIQCINGPQNNYITDMKL